MSEFNQDGYQVFSGLLSDEQLALLQADFAEQEEEILHQSIAAARQQSARSLGVLCLSKEGRDIVRGVYEETLTEVGLGGMLPATGSMRWAQEHISGQVLQPGARLQTHRDKPTNIATMTISLSEPPSEIGVWPLIEDPQSVHQVEQERWQKRKPVTVKQGDVVLLASRHPKKPDPMIANGVLHDVAYPGFHKEPRRSIIYWR
jgi:hypothetical protein